MVIGLDLGTTGLKAVLADFQGTVLAEASAANRLQNPRAGWVELDAQAHYRNVTGLLRELASAAPGGVAAVCMAGATGNTLLTDTGGNPMTPIINWMDQRAVRQPPTALAGLTPEAVARVTGWPCVNTFPLAHLAWLKENQPDAYRRAGHYGMDSDWLLYRLTGQWRMDYSTATTFHLQDQAKRRFHAPFLKRLDLDARRLSALTASGRVVGQLTEAAVHETGLSTRTVAVTGCFDHPAAARAVGVLWPGQLMLSCGTSWVGFAPFENREDVLEAGLLCDPFLSDADGAWGGIFSVPAIGPTIDAYIHEIIAPGEPDPLRVFDALAAEALPGSGGLTVDLRKPACAVTASRRDLSRAVMEGAVRLLREKLDALRARGFVFNEAVMVGGPSRSPIWPDIVAEGLELKLKVGGRSAGARGAAMLAAAALDAVSAVEP